MLKRLTAFLCMLTLLCGLLTTAGADVGTYYVKTANHGYLNLREDPTTNSTSMAKLDYGTPLTVVRFSNGWAYVKVNRQYGWVLASHISSTNPNGGGSSNPDYDNATLKNSIFEGFTPTSYSVIVNPTRRTGFVNLRWAPSTTASPMAIRYYGYELDVIQDNGVWCQVYDYQAGIVGFMMKEFLLITGYGARH